MTGRSGRRAGPPAEIRAAGAVLYREGAAGTEVAVIHRPGHDDWSLPKGKLEPGEHVLTAAVREVAEETGIEPVLGRPLATVRYEVDGRPKRVSYWAANADHAAARHEFAPGSEVDKLHWLPLLDARQRLSYAHDQRVLDRLAAPPGASWDNPGEPAGEGSGIRAAPDTVACVLLRHASAGRKGDTADDLARPLDERGEGQARALVPLLACFAPELIVSSAAERCLATVAPYAARIGAQVATEPALTVSPGQGTAASARSVMAALLADPRPMVACAHRENLPVLLEQALTTLEDQHPADDWAPPKAGFWVLHIGGGELAGLEHHTVAG